MVTTESAAFSNHRQHQVQMLCHWEHDFVKVAKKEALVSKHTIG